MTGSDGHGSVSGTRGVFRGAHSACAAPKITGNMPKNVSEEVLKIV